MYPDSLQKRLEEILASHGCSIRSVSDHWHLSFEFSLIFWLFGPYEMIQEYCFCFLAWSKFTPKVLKGRE